MTVESIIASGEGYIHIHVCLCILHAGYLIWSVFYALFCSREKWSWSFAVWAWVVTSCSSMHMLEQLLPCLKVSLLPLFELLWTLVGSSQNTVLHCHHFSLFLVFPTHLFNVYTFLQAQPLVRLLMHTSLFPALHLLLCLFFSFIFLPCSFFITDLYGAPRFILCSWRWLPKTLVLFSFFFSAPKKEQKRSRLLLRTRIWSVCLKVMKVMPHPQVWEEKECTKSTVLHSTFEEHQG